MAIAFASPCSKSSLFLLFVTLASSISLKNVTECSCGYYDETTQTFFTDSAIVYFNETTELPTEVFVPERYENVYEKGWNSRFRQGANATNVVVAQDLKKGGSSNTSLQLYIDPSTPEHLVVGGSVQTSRRDIFYGSFRTLMRSPPASAPGSALSMTLHHNDTQTINFDLMNPNPENAWVGMLSHEEFPNRDLGVNYSVLSNQTNGIAPWDYTEFRIDWTEKEVTYYIGGKPFRSISKSTEKSFPQTPTQLRLKHWSVGDWFTMQGPPTDRTVAHVGWVRMFFNSSLTTEQDLHGFAQRCSLVDACGTENMNLRGSSPYLRASTADWVQHVKPVGSRTIPKIILIISGAISACLLINAFIRRIPRRLKTSQEPTKPVNEKLHLPDYNDHSVGLTSEAAAAFPSSHASNFHSANVSGAASYYGDIFTPGTPYIPATPTAQKVVSSSRNSISSYIHMTTSSEYTHVKDETKKPRLSWREFSERMQELQQLEDQTPADNIPGPYVHHADDISVLSDRDSDVSSISADSGVSQNRVYGHYSSEMSAWPASEAMEVQVLSPTEFRSARNSMVISERTPAARTIEIFSAQEDRCSCPTDERLEIIQNIGTDKRRIDHLAGLLAFSCLLVTAIQFVLTFSPASVDPGADIHYKAESWARKYLSPYLLNLVVVGPFLITSARFLVSGYLENGELLDVAHKVIGRPFRLLIPILAIAMLEYFFMDSGATNWLEYLPSVTWSTWAFTTVPNNFGFFLSEILELAYLIPNAAPAITFNYCTGILWTIPVQLQNSWVSLLGVIVVREIKTPWKRFGYYIVCMLLHYYFLSWGVYFFFGIMITDLEMTYNYRKWLYARPLAYYPLIFLFICMTFGGLSLDLVTQLTGVNYASYEYGIHPDTPTGLPIMYTGATGYPQYYVPKLNGIVFAFGLQSLVELSPIVQRLFSLKPLLYIFPHIFTIYLIHGFIFWSLGSTVFIYLSAHHFAYWKIVIIVAICCYACLFVGVPILSPIVNTLGKGIARNIWVFAHETPSPRRPTLYPFPNNFLFVRQEYAQDVLAEASPGEVPALNSKDRGRFKKSVLGLAAVLHSRFNNQPCQPANVSLSRNNSISGPGVAARSVGWRTGGFSKNVAMLKRNNSNASRGRLE